MKGMVYKMDVKQLNELLDLALEQPEEVENEEMAKMFQELADDEKVHSAQLQKALELLNLNNQEKEEEGEEEAEEMLGNANEA